mmetsp:Transcript_10227/g.16565  ORF Transcript_10227/g.16565 Transcript_10227/m.16565 type:complete len:396 (+) Transcript_10227:110-1297(+)
MNSPDNDPGSSRTMELGRGGGDETFLTGGGIGGMEHPDTRFHKKANDVEDMERKLQQLKSNYGLKIRSLKDKEGEFMDRQQKTMANIDKFKTYIFDTDKKRKAFERRLAEKKKQGKKLDEEIDELKERLQKIQILNDRLDTSLDNIACYEEYLDEIITEEPSVSNKDEMIARYQLLAETKRLSEDKARTTETDVRQIQKETVSLDKVKQTDILLKKDRVSKLRERIEEVASKTSNSTEEMEQKDLKYKKTLRAVTAVRHSIFNLHILAQNSYPVPKHKEPFKLPNVSLQGKTQRERTDAFHHHMRKQLATVQDRLAELREIVPKSMMEQDDSCFLRISSAPTSGSRHRKGHGRQSMKQSVNRSMNRSMGGMSAMHANMSRGSMTVMGSMSRYEAD